jgi:hypothetical protein
MSRSMRSSLPSLVSHSAQSTAWTACDAGVRSTLPGASPCVAHTAQRSLRFMTPAPQAGNRRTTALWRSLRRPLARQLSSDVDLQQYLVRDLRSCHAR